MTTTKQHDLLNRLPETSFAPPASSALAFRHDYDSANQHVRRTECDSTVAARDEYGPFGEILSAPDNG